MFVRTASEHDLVAIRALLVETWYAIYDAIYGAEHVTAITDDWHSLASLKAQLARPNSEFLVADDGKRLGGMTFATATTDPKIVLLNQLHVSPDCQRQGIGQALLDEVEASFPQMRTLRLEVEQANAAAIAFYEANGFRTAGRTADCGGSSGWPALILEKRLG